MTEIVAGIVTRIVLEKKFDLSLFRRRFLMRWFKRFFLPAAMVMAASAVWAESSYSIANFYEVIVPDSGTKAVGNYDKVVDVKYILKPARMDTGKYVVEVLKIGDDLYRI